MTSKQKLKSLIKEKRTLMNFKVSKAEIKTIEANALLFAGGNVSAWLRYAAMNYKPKKGELKNVES